MVWCVFEEARKQSPDHHCRLKISAMDAALGMQQLLLMVNTVLVFVRFAHEGAVAFL